MILLVFPLIPVLVVLVAAAIGGTILATTRLKGKNIAILGPKGSGKTTFLNYLRGINSTAQEGTGREDYKTFTFTLNDGKKIKIKSGTDIGGGANYKALYEKMIKDSDAVIIVFDVNRYLNDKKGSEADKRNYQQLTHVRFKLIHDKIIETQGKIDPERIAVIGSHKDETGKDNEKLRQLFSESIKDKVYRDTLVNCHFCDLTDKNELNKTVNDIFGKNIFKK